MLRIAVCVLGLGLVGCGEESFEFICQTDMQCDEGGEGVCARKWCSYADDGCASGYRYAADADASVAEQCVSPSDLTPE